MKLNGFSTTTLRHLCLLSLGAITWLAAGCATNPVSGRQNFVLMSEADEISLGNRYAEEIEKQQPPYDNASLNAYVDRVGQRMAKVSHRQDLQYHFTVVDTVDVNAFALPGGHIYITRGLLAYLNTEAELAAVLGHEIGHVTARHSVRQQSAATATGVVGTILTIATGVQGTQDAFNILGGALLSGYGREHELESDRLGAQYMAAAGYEPQAMIKVIGVLKNQELFEKQIASEEGRQPRSYHGVFSTHPDNDTRLQEVVGEAGKVASESATYVGRDDFLSMVDGLTFGSSEAEGVIRGNSFLHKPLDFGLTFPAEWEIGNLPDRLLAVAPGKDAMLDIRLKPVEPGTPPSTILASLGIKNIRNGEPVQIKGFQAYTALAPVGTDIGARTARFIVLADRGNAFIFTGIAKNERELSRFEPAFLDTARTYHRLTAAEQAQASAHNIDVIKADAGTRMEDLARRSPVEKHALEQLRLLNDLYPDGQPRPGQRLKIVR